MVNERNHLALAALLCAALVSSAGRAADPPAAPKKPATASSDEAAAHFKRGMELYEDGDPSAALIEFKRAQAIAPHPRVLYNIGQVSAQLQDYAGAHRAFSELLSWPDRTAVTPERRAEVERELAKLSSRVGNLRVESSAAGAEVTVDDVPQGTTPLRAPLLVSAGRRRIGLLVPGRQGITRMVDVAGGDAVTIRIDPPLEVSTSGPVVAPAQPTRTSTWIAWGVTGTLAATTTVVGILALGASSDLASQRDRRDVTQGELGSTHDRMRSLAIATDVLGAATLAAGAIALYVTLKPGAPREAEPRAGLAVRPGRVSLQVAF